MTTNDQMQKLEDFKVPLEWFDVGKIEKGPSDLQNYRWTEKEVATIRTALTQLSEQAAKVKVLEDALRKLKQPHYSCEDAWYSCPLSAEGCADDRKPHKCDCGADDDNKIIEESLKGAGK